MISYLIKIAVNWCRNFWGFFWKCLEDFNVWYSGKQPLSFNKIWSRDPTPARPIKPACVFLSHTLVYSSVLGDIVMQHLAPIVAQIRRREKRHNVTFCVTTVRFTNSIDSIETTSTNSKRHRDQVQKDVCFHLQIMIVWHVASLP